MGIEKSREVGKFGKIQTKMFIEYIIHSGWVIIQNDEKRGGEENTQNDGAEKGGRIEQMRGLKKDEKKRLILNGGVKKT